MRSVRLALITAILLLAAPTAAASHEAKLGLGAASSDLSLKAGETREVRVTVYLNLTDFSCFEDAKFPVQIGIRSSDEARVNASFSVREVMFDVPSQSYLGRTYEGQANVSALVTALEGPANATLNVTSYFQHSGEPCLAPNGFGPVWSNMTLNATVAAPPAPVIDDNATNDNETPEGNETPDDNITLGEDGPASGNATTRPPPPGSGPIGEYDPNKPAENTDGGSSIPAPAIPLVIAGVAAVAFALRRKGT